MDRALTVFFCVLCGILMVTGTGTAGVTGKANLIVRQTETNLSRPAVQVGDILDVELFVEGNAEAITGVAVYLNFDDAYFELIPAARYKNHVTPFWQGSWMLGTVLTNSTLGDQIGSSKGNRIPRFQLFYNENIPRAHSGQQRAAQGDGIVARFQLLVIHKPPEPLTAIVVDQVSSTGGISGYFVQDDPGNLRQFAAVQNMLVPIQDGTVQVADTGFIATVAGNGKHGFSSDGGPATDAELNHPHAICADGSGNLYIADTDNHRIRKVDTAGTMTTVVGDGFRSGEHGRFSGDWGPAILASLNRPHGVFLDGTGNLYIADTDNHRVRKVDTSGNISTVAGTGKRGFTGDGVVAIFGRLNRPYGVCVDRSGNVYIADKDNHRVRKVDTAGVMTTVAGNGSRGYSGDGVPATLAKLNRPRDVVVDGSGNLYIADTDNHRVRKVDTAGIMTTVAGTGESRFYGDGRPATSAGLTPSSVYLDSAGNLYIADKGYGRIRKVNLSGSIVTLAGNGKKKPKGDGGPATEIALKDPSGVVVDSEGTLYFSESATHRIRKVTPSPTQGGRPVTDPPEISILPAEVVNFGEMAVGEKKTLRLSISNAGEDTLKVLNVVASSKDFAVSETGFSLDTHQEKTLKITFQPGETGKVKEVLELPTNDPNRPTVRIPLQATVRPNTDGVSRFMTDIDILEFGAVGATGIAKLKLPIRNEGAKTLYVFNVVSTDLQVAVTPKSLSIRPGKQRALTVRFRPRSGRERTGEIILNSDDPDRSTVKIPWKGTVGIAEKALDVVASTPKVGATDIPEKTELVLTFNEPLLKFRKFVALDAKLIPQAVSGPLLDHFSLDKGARTIRFPVALAPDTYYRLVVRGAKGKSGEKLEAAFKIGFSTGSAPVALGNIFGTVKFVDGRAFEGSVVLFDSKGTLIGREAIGEGGRYALSNLPAGDYQVFADLFAEGIGPVSGGYDANGDGLADALKLIAGQDVKGIDLVLSAPVAADTTDTPPPPVNGAARAALDLDSTPGNQVQKTLAGVQPEDEFLVAVYAAQTVDLVGYTVTLAYDTTQVLFKRVDENSLKDEKNLLFSAGGSAVFIRTPPQDGRAQVAGAILGPTRETTPSGDGLLGLFRFVAREGFSKADFQIARLILQSGAVQDTVTVGAAAVVSSASGGGQTRDPGSEIPGPVRVDLNPSEGNQGLTTQTGVKPGDTVRVQLFADRFPEVTGFGFHIEFDPNMLIYKEQSFAAGDFISGASPLVTDRGGLLEVGVASLTGATGRGSAILGQLDFQVADAFADSAYLAVTTVGLSLKDGAIQDRKVRIIARLRSAAGSLEGDFDGDGSVGFRDFLIFAQAFGSADARFDLDGDGTVGFRDFLTFAQTFGRSAKRASKPAIRPMGSPGEGDGPGANRDARMSLEPVASEAADEIGIAVRLTDVVRIQGYGLRLVYDASAVALVSATAQQTSVFAETAGPQPVTLQAQSQDGEIFLADVLRPEAAVEGSAEVVRLVFRVLDGTVPGRVEVAGALVADGLGKVNRIPGARLEGLLPMPSTYTLSRNVPNPFNPSTQIAYQLPEPGEVSLVIYNLLGQQVRALVQDHQEAGAYRVTWDGTDAYGRPVASGVYLYRLTSGTFIQTHRMMLLK